MQTTNRQNLIDFVLAQSTENDVLATVDTTNATGMAINGGKHFHADTFNDTAITVTFRLYEMATEDSVFVLIATYIVPPGAESIDFPSAGTTEALSGFRIRLTADPGANDVTLSVAAIITA